MYTIAKHSNADSSSQCTIYWRTKPKKVVKSIPTEATRRWGTFLTLSRITRVYNGRLVKILTSIFVKIKMNKTVCGLTKFMNLSRKNRNSNIIVYYLNTQRKIIINNKYYCQINFCCFNKVNRGTLAIIPPQA